MVRIICFIEYFFSQLCFLKFLLFFLLFFSSITMTLSSHFFCCLKTSSVPRSKRTKLEIRAYSWADGSGYLDVFPPGIFFPRVYVSIMFLVCFYITLSCPFYIEIWKGVLLCSPTVWWNAWTKDSLELITYKELHWWANIFLRLEKSRIRGENREATRKLRSCLQL